MAIAGVVNVLHSRSRMTLEIWSSNCSKIWVLMARPRFGSRLVKRGSVWWFRWPVPQAFRAQFGRREIWRSLRTTDHDSAQQKAAKRIEELRAQCARFE